MNAGNKFNLIGCYNYMTYNATNLNKYCLNKKVSKDECINKCRNLSLKYASLVGRYSIYNTFHIF